MYKAVCIFTDLKDGNREYKPGDVYPAKGAKRPTKARIAELLSSSNKQGRPVIVEVEDGDTGSGRTDQE